MSHFAVIVVPIVRKHDSLALTGSNLACLQLRSWIPWKPYVRLPRRCTGTHLMPWEYNHSCCKWVCRAGHFPVYVCFTTICGSSMCALECEVAGWLVPMQGACAALKWFLGQSIRCVYSLFFVFSLPSRVPLPAVGGLSVLRREDCAVGLPRASLHGHRCS